MSQQHQADALKDKDTALKEDNTAEEEEESMAHETWCEHKPKTEMLIQPVLVSVATKLNSKDFISSTLYDNIVSLNSIGMTENHRTTLLFRIIERKLRSEDQTISEKTWKALIATLKTQCPWKPIATDMGK